MNNHLEEKRRLVTRMRCELLDLSHKIDAFKEALANAEEMKRVAENLIEQLTDSESGEAA